MPSRDDRVRICCAIPFPRGWCGKQEETTHNPRENGIAQHILKRYLLFYAHPAMVGPEVDEAFGSPHEDHLVVGNEVVELVGSSRLGTLRFT